MSVDIYIIELRIYIIHTCPYNNIIYNFGYVMPPGLYFGIKKKNVPIVSISYLLCILGALLEGGIGMDVCEYTYMHTYIYIYIIMHNDSYIVYIYIYIT
jgi:hypothetical protein